MTINEAAKLLECTRRTILNMIRDGRLTYISIGPNRSPAGHLLANIDDDGVRWILSRRLRRMRNKL